MTQNYLKNFYKEVVTEKLISTLAMELDRQDHLR